MAFNFNPIPAIHAGHLTLFEDLRRSLSNLKDSMSNTRGKVKISKDEAYQEVSKRMDETVLWAISQEQYKIRTSLESDLLNIVRFDVLDSWLKVSGDTPILYIVTIEGRSQKELAGKKQSTPGGFKKASFPVLVSRYNDLKANIGSVLVTDQRFENSNIASQLEAIVRVENGIDDNDSLHLLSVVHTFVPAVPINGNGVVWDGPVFSNGDLEQSYLAYLSAGSLSDIANALRKKFQPSKDAPRVDARIKSGPENTWKQVAYLNGTRGGIADYAAMRLRGPESELWKKLDEFFDSYHKEHSIDWEHSIALQNMDLQEFLAVMGKKSKFYRRAVKETESRAPIKVNGKEVLPKYVSMSLPICGKKHSQSEFHAPFGDEDLVYCHNQAEAQVISNGTFTRIEGNNGRNHLAYKARSDENRVDVFNPIDWAVAVCLAATYSPDVQRYLLDVFDNRAANGLQMPILRNATPPFLI